MNKTILIASLLILVAGGGGFYGGMKYQQTKRPTFTGQSGTRGQRLGATANGGNAAGNFRPVTGSIIKSDGNIVTVKLQDGSSKLVTISDSTTIGKSASATRDDLKIGEQVSVFGQQNADGSVSAQNIQLGNLPQNGRTGQ